MKITSVTETKTFIVKTDSGEYQRGEHGGWWELMGNTYEEAYDDGTLEVLFK